MNDPAGKQGRVGMAWKKPRITEISLALEINSYACADIG
jgi:coenzyme PQQ precursor peptide PqqA